MSDIERMTVTNAGRDGRRGQERRGRRRLRIDERGSFALRCATGK